MNKKHLPIWTYLIISFCISTLWQMVGGRMYGYKYNYTIAGINLYAWMLWGLGLWLVMILYDVIEWYFRLKNKYAKFITFILFYWIALIIFETVAYHIIGTKNLVTGMYPGLPICDCIHAPVWMKIVYFCLGPLMYITTRMFKVKNVFGKRK